MKKIEIPFGASDSELDYQELIIPEGLEAVMEDGKIILRKKESKDERIRKELIEYFRWNAQILNDFDNREVIAWLEKQGDNNNQNWKPSKEQIGALEYFVRSIGESGYASPYDSNTKLLYSLINDLYELEKQGEQKPSEWSEEDSIRLQRIIDFLWYNRKGDTDTIYQQEQDIDWLKSLKERII